MDWWVLKVVFEVCSAERKVSADCCPANSNVIGDTLLCPSVTVAQSVDALSSRLCTPQQQQDREQQNDKGEGCKASDEHYSGEARNWWVVRFPYTIQDHSQNREPTVHISSHYAAT